jgi:hypothetical protein
VHHGFASSLGTRESEPESGSGERIKSYAELRVERTDYRAHAENVLSDLEGRVLLQKLLR